ncbi:MAG: ATP-binding cassette domain-containing protein [Candidatus Nanopelagicales bacterium]|jgi:ATPase subunit of ABC transporter with duplicated ATPase domains|nr:ATP-binding cassette domain-containing protein [Candidatus Nanopelagicales bacterium]
MGAIEVNGIAYRLPTGRLLFDDVSFRVGEGITAALVGDNGAGKSTLFKIITGVLNADEGSTSVSGGLGVMPQLLTGAAKKVEENDTALASLGLNATVADALKVVSPKRIQEAIKHVEACELAMMEDESEEIQMKYAHALAEYADAGGYDNEILWDVCCQAAVGMEYEKCKFRELKTLSGGQAKRLILEALLRGPDQVLLLDEPDNYLDVPAKNWLEDQLRESSKTILLISHDRTLLTRAADRIITIEGGTSWVHGKGFGTYYEARQERHERLGELLKRWEDEHQRLKDLVQTLHMQTKSSPAMAPKYRAMQTRLKRFEEAGAPQAPPPPQRLKMKLKGGRTAVRAIVCKNLQLTDLTKPFDMELFYGERVAFLGGNGTGKSHFLRLLGGDETVRHIGDWKLGSRVVPGWFAQTHDHPEWSRKTLTEILWEEKSLQIAAAVGTLSRYGLGAQSDQLFLTLSGGQQARFQICLLELSGATLLLLDEPTDNLDITSSEALEAALDVFDGTVLTVTHDRWFVQNFDRFFLLDKEGNVKEVQEPVWT